MAHLATMAPRARRLSRLLAWATLAGVALAAGTLAACASTSTSGATGADEAGRDGSTRAEGSIAESDGGATGTDASVPATFDGPGEAGAECAFNRDCQAALRCECTESAGCACKPGARGTGQNGVTPCSDGNACASSVCTEGPPDSGSFCSDACKTSADCTGKLPLCSDIAFVGRICIRQPPP